MTELEEFREAQKAFIDRTLNRAPETPRDFERTQATEDNLSLVFALPEMKGLQSPQDLDKTSPNYGATNFMFGMDAFGDPNRPFG